MQIILDISDDLAQVLTALGQDPTRAALEAFVLQAYRQRRLSGYRLRTLLGLSSRWDLHALLKKHQIDMYTLEDFEKDLANNEELWKKRQAEIPST